jgi:hypothetical protein
MTLPTTAPSLEGVPSNQVFIKVYPLSRLNTEKTGSLPIRARSGNQYVMIASPKVTAIELQPTRQ